MKINFANPNKSCNFAVANGEKSVCRKKAHFRLILRCELRHFTESNAKGIVKNDAPVGLFMFLNMSTCGAIQNIDHFALQGVEALHLKGET